MQLFVVLSNSTSRHGPAMHFNLFASLRKRILESDSSSPSSHPPHTFLHATTLSLTLPASRSMSRLGKKSYPITYIAVTKMYLRGDSRLDRISIALLSLFLRTVCALSLSTHVVYLHKINRMSKRLRLHDKEYEAFIKVMMEHSRKNDAFIEKRAGIVHNDERARDEFYR